MRVRVLGVGGPHSACEAQINLPPDLDLPPVPKRCAWEQGVLTVDLGSCEGFVDSGMHLQWTSPNDEL